MAVNNDPGKNKVSEQNPVRLTLGHYYCSNCGEDCLSRSDARCPQQIRALLMIGIGIHVTGSTGERPLTRAFDDAGSTLANADLALLTPTGESRLRALVFKDSYGVVNGK